MGQPLIERLVKSYCISILKVSMRDSSLGYLESILPEPGRMLSLPIPTGDRHPRFREAALSNLFHVSES